MLGVLRRIPRVIPLQNFKVKSAQPGISCFLLHSPLSSKKGPFLGKVHDSHLRPDKAAYPPVKKGNLFIADINDNVVVVMYGQVIPDLR